VNQYQKQFDYIARSEDAVGLRNLIARARELNAPEVAEAAFRKLVTLGIDHPAGSVEHDFWQTIQAFEAVLKEERGKTIRLARTRQKVARVGVRQTLADWAEVTASTEGYDMLLQRGMAELTGEAIVLRHASEFPGHIVEAARDRLRRSNVDIDALPSKARCLA
jgi:hypothetical protein